MEKSRAELFAEINVIPPTKDSDNESVEGNEDSPEGETKDGEKEEELQAEKPPKKKKRKTKKKSDANKENRPAVKDKLVSFNSKFLLCISLASCDLVKETLPQREYLDSLFMQRLIRPHSGGIWHDLLEGDFLLLAIFHVFGCLSFVRLFAN